ncbi:radical SAM domain-containing protein, partial [mine drainage metagenome]
PIRRDWRARREMTTNGYLLDLATLTALVELQQKRYQITLDGDEPEHNRTRRSASGEKTFDKIWSNLVTAHQSSLDFSIILRLHIMPGNADSLFRLADRIIGELNGDSRFNIFIREISNLGGPTSGQIAYITRQEAQATADKLAHMFEDQGISAISGVAGLFESQVEVKEIGKIDREHDEPIAPYICYAAKPYHFVIRPTGKIVKCTVDFNSDRNAVGELHADGTITLDSAKMDYWARGYKSHNSLELGCPAHAKS